MAKIINCENCSFWFVTQTRTYFLNDASHPVEGECRRKSPVHEWRMKDIFDENLGHRVSRKEPVAVWVITSSNHGCGEGSEKGDIEDA